MNRLLVNVRTAASSLLGHWRRAVLSMLGIFVASVAIMLLVSIAQGVREDITSQVRELGVNVLVVIPGRIESGSFNPNLGGQSFLSEEDARRLASVSGVVRTAPWTFVGGGIRRGEKAAYPMLVATTAEWFEMSSMKVQRGRSLTAQDDLKPVCIIGSVAAKELFGDADPIGKEVTINGKRYSVIGLTKDKGSEQSLFSMGSLQNLVYIPYRYMKQLDPKSQTDRIMVQVQPDAEPKALIKNMEGLLGQRLDRQQFQVLTQEDLLGLVYKLMGILTWLLTGLTSIALFVGGIGIMAVMIMSAGERTAEIGLRKAVGARAGDVFTQFLSEAVLIAVAGGALGIVFSAIVCEMLRAWTPIKPLISLGTVALALGVCVGIGALAGVLPALSAAKKNPVSALRHAG